jgi:hypothetical protein
VRVGEIALHRSEVCGVMGVMYVLYVYMQLSLEGVE